MSLHLNLKQNIISSHMKLRRMLTFDHNHFSSPDHFKYLFVFPPQIAAYFCFSQLQLHNSVCYIQFYSHLRGARKNGNQLWSPLPVTVHLHLLPC